MSSGEQCFAEMAALKAGAAGNENPHRKVLPSDDMCRIMVTTQRRWRHTNGPDSLLPRLSLMRVSVSRVDRNGA